MSSFPQCLAVWHCVASRGRREVVAGPFGARCDEGDTAPSVCPCVHGPGGGGLAVLIELEARESAWRIVLGPFVPDLNET